LRHQARRNDRRLWLRARGSTRDQVLLFAWSGKVLAIDSVPERFAKAQSFGTETLDYKADELQEQIRAITEGKGPDSVIEAA
jgi:threonine dehydrogenase-like Zn-dependent dehydrogenase